MTYRLVLCKTIWLLFLSCWSAWTCYTQAAQAGSQVPEISFARNPVEDIFFLDDKHGWVAIWSKKNSFLLITVDGGRSWTKVGTETPFRIVSFIDSENGWALGQGPRNNKGPEYQLLRTQDGGNTWRVVSVPISSSVNDPVYVMDFRFVDQLRGWILASGSLGSSVILDTNDGGSSVKELYLTHTYMLLGLFAGQDGHLWAYGHDVLLHSADYGWTWRSQIRPENTPGGRRIMRFTSAFVFGDGHGWVVGGGPKPVMLKTKDFGRNWDMGLELDVQGGTLENVFFVDPRHGCAVGSTTYLVCTRDGGKTWESMASLPSAKKKQSGVFRRVVMLPSGRGWVLREGGYLYETRDFGRSWQERNLVASIR